jgi:hypothetical protein
MDFFNSLSLDLKLLIVGIAGTALLALFSGNAKSEKRYMVVLVLLSAAGVYRFAHHAPSGDEIEARAAATSVSHGVVVPDRHVPLISTSAK